MVKMHLEAPWFTYQKKVKALFEQDPEILVGELTEGDGEFDYALNIEVASHEKYEALDRVMPSFKRFGNILVKIILYDEENAGINPGVKLYETIFKDNPILEDVRNMVDKTGTAFGYVRFKPEVIQFFDDNLADYNGNWSGLAEDIAKEVFEKDSSGMYFCTAPAMKNTFGS